MQVLDAGGLVVATAGERVDDTDEMIDGDAKDDNAWSKRVREQRMERMERRGKKEEKGVSENEENRMAPIHPSSLIC